jgi:hypothetical protein
MSDNSSFPVTEKLDDQDTIWTPEIIEPGDATEDPTVTDCACDPEFDEADGEFERHDATKGCFYLRSDGRPWAWFIPTDGGVYSKDGGHHHEVLYEADDDAQQDSPPGGYTYHRDGIDTGAYFDHLDEALTHVRREIEAQYVFEERLWLAFRCSGAVKAQREYVLSHSSYTHRVTLIEEALESRRKVSNPG